MGWELTLQKKAEPFDQEIFCIQGERGRDLYHHLHDLIEELDGISIAVQPDADDPAWHVPDPKPWVMTRRHLEYMDKSFPFKQEYLRLFLDTLRQALQEGAEVRLINSC